MSNVNTPRALQRLLATDAGWGPLALRLPIGIIFVALFLIWRFTLSDQAKAEQGKK